MEDGIARRGFSRTPRTASCACAPSSASRASASTRSCCTRASAGASTPTSARRRSTWCSRARSPVVEGEEADARARRGDPGRPGVRRQLVNRGPAPLHLLAFGGAGEHEGRDGRRSPTGTRPTRSHRRRRCNMPRAPRLRRLSGAQSACRERRASTDARAHRCGCGREPDGRAPPRAASPPTRRWPAGPARLGSAPHDGRHRNAPASARADLARGEVPRAAAVLGRAGHERDAQVDPGRVRGRGRRADGQPRAARRGLRRRRGQGEQLGAVAAEVVDAREEFASDYVVPAIKANAIYGLGYPLFTALGRPLIAKLAVESRASTAATRSPTAAPARATTRSASRRRSRRSRRS